MTHFKETQKLRIWWVWLILLGTNAMNILNIVHQKSFEGVLLPTIILTVVTMLIFLMKIETRIDHEGVHYQMFPFHFSNRTILWKHIKNIYVREYQPIRNYGGWGLRGLPKNKAITLYGTNGIQIELENGNKILVGTQLPDEAQIIIQELKLQQVF